MPCCLPGKLKNAVEWGETAAVLPVDSKASLNESLVVHNLKRTVVTENHCTSSLIAQVLKPARVRTALFTWRNSHRGISPNHTPDYLPKCQIHLILWLFEWFQLLCLHCCTLVVIYIAAFPVGVCACRSVCQWKPQFLENQILVGCIDFGTNLYVLVWARSSCQVCLVCLLTLPFQAVESLLWALCSMCKAATAPWTCFLFFSWVVRLADKIKLD